MTTITILDGSFEPAEGIELIRMMLRIKIQYHENKIQKDSTEEDVKMRERRIKQLQEEMDRLNQIAAGSTLPLQIHGQVSIA